MELEQEAMFYIALYKVKLVTRKIADYIRTIEQDEVNLSGAFYQSPESRAEYAVRDLITNDFPKFERLYELADKEL